MLTYSVFNMCIVSLTQKFFFHAVDLDFMRLTLDCQSQANPETITFPLLSSSPSASDGH